MINRKYDLLVVGSGLYGAVVAWKAKQKGMKCLVIDSRAHIAGNIYTNVVAGIDVHKYGAHIFHTNNSEIWKFINNFAEFNGFINSPIANYKGRLYNLPFNMNTFYQIWGVKTPQEAQSIIEEQRKSSGIGTPKNLEEQAISLVGYDIYNKLIKGYTEKQWGRPCTELPPSIIKRLPVRFLYDNNYFNAKYQGVPLGGYTQLVENMLKGTEVILNADYLTNRSLWNEVASKIVYTGAIDRYFNYCFGALEYRCVKFDTEVINTKNFQGVAVMNFTDKSVPYTRVIEHKHFTFGEQEKTVVSREYSVEWKKGDEPYYPINDEKNQLILKKYKKLADREENIYFGGRLGLYRYLDMDQTIEEALTLSNNIL